MPLRNPSMPVKIRFDEHGAIAEMADHYSVVEVEAMVLAMLAGERPARLTVDMTGSRQDLTSSDLERLADLFCSVAESVRIVTGDVLGYGFARAIEGFSEIHPVPVEVIQS